MKEINILIMGCGMIAGFHAQAIAQTGGVRLYGAYDADPSRAAAWAEKYGCRCFDSEEAALASDADVIAVCTPSGTHAELTERILRAGKHVIVEKPLGMTADECDVLLSAEAASGRRIFPVFQLRLSPGVREAKRILESGELGKLLLVSASMRFSRPPSYYENGWHKSRAMDGGVLLNQAIHGIDLLCMLAGQPTSVCAHAATLVHRIESADTVAAVLTLPSGGFATLEAGTALCPGQPTRITLNGSRGSLVLEDDRLILRDGQPLPDAGDADVSGSRDPAAIGCAGHVRFYEDILRTLRDDLPPACTSSDAAATVRLIDAMQRSAAEGTLLRLR